MGDKEPIMVNPLLFIPSVRQIPEVIESWDSLPYDKFIVRRRLEHISYKNGRDFFLENKQYTHLVICPDDLVIDYDSFHLLKRDIEKYDYDNLSGIANIDESQPDVYCCKPENCDMFKTSKGAFYDVDTIPKQTFIAGFGGFACQWINRRLMEKLSFTGGCNNGTGCMDVKFAEEIKQNNSVLLVNPNALFYHMRMAQYHQVRAWKNAGHEENEGYTIHLKHEKYQLDDYI